jgi:hypothetical protein
MVRQAVIAYDREQERITIERLKQMVRLLCFPSSHQFMHMHTQAGTSEFVYDADRLIPVRKLKPHQLPTNKFLNILHAE